MSGAQRDLALALLRASLSADGFDTARDVMRLNELVRVMTGSDEEYGEWLYWLSLLGLPSPDQPWGWQLDGHHLIVNCFVLGDQVVMTPLFMGSEPVAFPDGARVFGAEEQQGLALVRALTDAQRGRVILSPTLPGEAFTAAFRDNFELRYEGLRFDQLSTAQQALLVDLLATYVGRIRPGHAEIRMEEVRRHLGETHFAWMGRVRRGQRLLLPRGQLRHPRRVRPPARHRVRQRRAVTHPYPHGGAYAERQRLWPGPAAPAPRAVRPLAPTTSTTEPRGVMTEGTHRYLRIGVRLAGHDGEHLGAGRRFERRRAAGDPLLLSGREAQRPARHESGEIRDERGRAVEKGRASSRRRGATRVTRSTPRSR